MLVYSKGRRVITTKYSVQLGDIRCVFDDGLNSRTEFAIIFYLVHAKVQEHSLIEKDPTNSQMRSSGNSAPVYVKETPAGPDAVREKGVVRLCSIFFLSVFLGARFSVSVLNPGSHHLTPTLIILQPKQQHLGAAAPYSVVPVDSY